MRKRSWTVEDLKKAVAETTSLRATLFRLGLVPAGGNYAVVLAFIKEYHIDRSHHLGHAWNRGNTGGYAPRRTLKEVLKNGSSVQSFKLKKRLFREGLKAESCELCGWSAKSIDGRIPLELDHINGNRLDNRLMNLRVLCPNCHSLQPTHRGRNIRSRKQ